MTQQAVIRIRDARADEFEPLGRLMVEAYAQLEGFPKPEEQPRYYRMLADVGRFTEKQHTRLLVAHVNDELAGGVVYFGDMAEYGSGGTATSERNAGGIRLLAVDGRFRGMGVGKALTRACIDIARQQGHHTVVLHTTQAMQTAWRMYEQMNFRRAEDLDFSQESLSVYGFRLALAGTEDSSGENV